MAYLAVSQQFDTEEIDQDLHRKIRDVQRAEAERASARGSETKRKRGFAAAVRTVSVANALGKATKLLPDVAADGPSEGRSCRDILME